MALLPYEGLSRGIAPDYVRRLFAAFPAIAKEPTPPPKSQFPESDLVEPLSDREIEVLQVIAEGLTNREIASRLFLSLHTVKVHTRSINRKLGVYNRTHAVIRGRALGILPSIQSPGGLNWVMAARSDNFPDRPLDFGPFFMPFPNLQLTPL